jgi:hypothetical protein
VWRNDRSNLTEINFLTSSARAFAGTPPPTDLYRQRHSQPGSGPSIRRPTRLRRAPGPPADHGGSWHAYTRYVRLVKEASVTMLYAMWKERETAAYKDGCGYRDGACAARVDVAKSV